VKQYYGYLKYVLEHKKNVFIECWKEGLYLHAFTHDLSKFLPIEFIPYAEWFYGFDGVYLKDKYNYEQLNNGESCVSNNYLKCKSNFEEAWQHHFKHNKHHWDYWVNDDGIALNMPIKYIRQMLCDWKAMSRKFGDTPQLYYKNNRNKMNLSISTRCHVEYILGFIDGMCAVGNVTWDDYLKRNNFDEDKDFQLIK
jgi:hypothetical protein